VRLFRFVFFIFLCAGSVPAGAITTIGQVRFEGNDVTQEVILRRELYCHEGDELTQACVEASVQGIRDLGLFKYVGYYMESDEAYADDATDSRINVVYQVKEKHFLLVLPRYRVKDNEQHVGIQLRWDNIDGMNQNLRWLLEDRGKTLGINEQRHQIDYTIPNIADTKFSFDLRYVDINSVDDSVPGFEVNRMDEEYRVSSTKWLNPRGRNIGWFASAGVGARYRHNDMLDSALTDTNIDAIFFNLGYGFSEVHDYGYNRGGKEYGYDLELSHHWMGSDSEYAKHILYYRSYYRFSSVPDDNLNVQTILGHATNDIMDDEAFNLGAEELRGYESGRFTGNAMLQVNMEYQTPAEDHPRVRYVVFWDLGNTYDDVRDVIHGGLKSGVGVGIRWKIPSFVKLDLRLDIGYGITDKDYQATAGTHYSF